jgi:glucan 1,3-beta-glucosidase
VEWNVAGDAPGNAGTWDTHIRIGGAAGTNTLIAQCPKGNQNFASCSAAFLSLHLTKTSSAYLEGLWAWTAGRQGLGLRLESNMLSSRADHDAEDQAQGQTAVFTGRGILSESQGPVWMVGTASEHAALYQYALVDAKNHYMGLIQTETVSSSSQIHGLHG